MRFPLLLLTLSALAVGLAGCADDADESGTPDARNDSSAMCLEGAEDCDDMPTTETISDPYQVGT